jgi:2-isopropylmalate synthase
VQGTELGADDIWALFSEAYHLQPDQIVIDQQHVDQLADGRTRLSARWRIDNQDVAVQATGQGPLDAFVQGVERTTGLRIEVVDFHEHALGAGADARAVAYLALRIADTPTLFGVGIDSNIATASMKAVISGLLRSGLAFETFAAASATITL